jgi:hypothetical protein
MTREPETHHRPWSATGVGSELDLVLSRNIAIPVRAFAVLPLARDRYQFAPVTFYHTPLVTFGVQAGLSIRFR